MVTVTKGSNTMCFEQKAKLSLLQILVHYHVDIITLVIPVVD
jgi:hypothetical protein